MPLRLVERVNLEVTNESVAIVVIRKSVTIVVEIGIAQNAKRLQKKDGLRSEKQSF